MAAILQNDYIVEVGRYNYVPHYINFSLLRLPSIVYIIYIPG